MKKNYVQPAIHNWCRMAINVMVTLSVPKDSGDSTDEQLSKKRNSNDSFQDNSFSEDIFK
jgi:hypothetical protein